MNILKELGIKAVNYGACSGTGKWSDTTQAGEIVSINPANGKKIASVYQCSESDYDRIVSDSAKVFKKWRKVPAPVRGELVRQMGEALREKKDALGSLVSLEMGKIKQEGDGEVQEMIDIADFAVGQSRMLYGKTMHSERLDHRMYEQWHPLGIVGVISAFNFPVAVWAWNAFLNFFHRIHEEVNSRFVHQGSHQCVRIQRITGLYLSIGMDQFRNKLIVTFLMNQYPASGCAPLTCRSHRSKNNCRDNQIHIGSFINNKSIVST